MTALNFKGTLTVQKEIVLHFFFWLLLCYFTLINFERGNPYYFSIAEPDLFLVFWLLVFVLTFYFNYCFVMPRVFRNFNWKKAVLGILAAYLFFVSARFLLEQVLMRLLFDQSNYFEGTHPLYYLYDNLYYSTLPLIPSTLVWLIVFLIRLLEYNAFISEEKREIEVKFLKSQLNPHFLFNTLNNIYSLVYFNSEKALPAIEKLSGIMRFTTYESQKDKIKLEDEINYIKSYIELEELRQNNDLFVKLNVATENLQFELPPLVLSPLVENALKHGVWNAERPVEILLECIDKQLLFRITNLVGKKKKDQVPGIGIENLKKRLQIYYPDKHRLVLKEQNQQFTAQLEIQL